MRFVTSLRVEKPRPDEGRGGQINFVVFEEGVEQSLLLSLPLTAGGAPNSGWLFDKFFQQVEAP